MDPDVKVEKPNLFIVILKRFLDRLEVLGNKLPDPSVLFIGFCCVVIAFSAIGSTLGWSIKHPSTGETMRVFNLLSPAGLQYIVSNVYLNFVNFAPFAISVSVFLAVGITDKSGLLEKAFICLGMSVSRRMLTVVVVFIGIMSHIMSDIGFVILPPLAALMFRAVGRNPILGMCCAYAAVGCGFAANFVISLGDARLAGMTQAAAQIVDPNFIVSPTCNWYFLIGALLFLVCTATFVTDKILEPHMRPWTPQGNIKKIDLDTYQTTPLEKKGMWAAGISLLLVGVFFFVGAVPSWGFLCDPNGVSVFGNPKTQVGAIITTMLLCIALPGVVYGKIVGTIKNSQDFANGMAAGIKIIAPFAVLCFFAGQFTFWFTKTNLGIICAVNAAEFIKATGFIGLPLLYLLIFIYCLSDFICPSLNAKWAMFAPIVVPMCMLIGYHPALAQLTYRIGDAITNDVTPLMAYMAILVNLVREYDPKAGLGTLMSYLAPYAMCYGVTYVILFTIWYLLGLPLGPGGSIYLN